MSLSQVEMDLEYLGRLKAMSIKLHVSSEKMTPHQEKVLKTVIEGNFGCKRGLVQNFASAFMNHKFDDNNLRKSCKVIVSPEGHKDYNKNQPICLINNIQGFRYEKSQFMSAGSTINDDAVGKFRQATPEEIDLFYSEVQKDEAILMKFCSYMHDHSTLKS
jgi:F0F1-type ATP synthase gamma subunit